MPAASFQTSPGSAEGVHVAPGCDSQFMGRNWPQVIAPAASASPHLALPPGNKSPKRSRYKVSIQLIMDNPPRRKQLQTPDICSVWPPGEGTSGFLSQVH